MILVIVKLYFLSVLGLILMVILLFGVLVLIKEIELSCRSLFFIFFVSILSFDKGKLLIIGILIICCWNFIWEILIGFMLVGKVVILLMWSFILLSIFVNLVLVLIFSVIVLLLWNVCEIVCLILVMFFIVFLILMKIFFLIFWGEVLG